jgi:hypothetical protein
MPQEQTVTQEQAVKGFQEAQAKYLTMLKAAGKMDELRTIETAERPLADRFIWATADVSLIFGLFKGKLTADLTFDDGKKVHFEGLPWGIGMGVLAASGKYYGDVGAAKLVVDGGGNCHYHCQFVATPGGGGIQMTFWRDNFGTLGQVIAFSFGGGVAETGGDDGKFTWAR